MAVRIRLQRLGKIHHPQYRIVVTDARKKRDGRTIEDIGIYHPKEEPSRIEVNSERVQYWLSVGAQPSDPVQAILRKTGDWQKFKGLPPPPNPVKVAAPKADRHAVYEAEAKAAAGLADQPGKGDATTAKKAAKKATKKAAGKADDKPAGKAEAEKAEGKAEKAEGKAEKAEGKADSKAEGKSTEKAAEQAADKAGADAEASA